MGIITPGTNVTFYNSVLTITSQDNAAWYLPRLFDDTASNMRFILLG